MVKMDFSKFESKFWKSRVWYHRYKNCKPSHLVRLTILLETVHFVPNEKKVDFGATIHVGLTNSLYLQILGMSNSGPNDNQLL